jgi:N-acetylmuramoyl-L-alanine amidase
MSTHEPLPHVAIVVGHRSNAKGAATSDGLTEWDYNMEIAPALQKALAAMEVDSVVIERPTRSAAGRSPILRMVDKVNDTGALLALELHLNAASSPWASGTEVLYYERSRGGHLLASRLLGPIVGALGTRSRGVKPCGVESRGGAFLSLTQMPAAIVEPAFVSHEGDLRTLRLAKSNGSYVRALAQGVVDYLREEGAL